MNRDKGPMDLPPENENASKPGEVLEFNVANKKKRLKNPALPKWKSGSTRKVINASEGMESARQRLRRANREGLRRRFGPLDGAADAFNKRVGPEAGMLNFKVIENVGKDRVTKIVAQYNKQTAVGKPNKALDDFYQREKDLAISQSGLVDNTPEALLDRLQQLTDEKIDKDPLEAYALLLMYAEKLAQETDDPNKDEN